MGSTHCVEVVPVHLEPHPNADSLSLVHVYGYQVVVRTEDWTDGQLGAYIPPDSIVPDTAQFAFLDGHRHIKAHRFRGEISMGLLVHAPEGAAVGDDVADVLGITHYEPPLTFGMGSTVSPPPGFHPVYDVESLYRYPGAFVDGEPIVVTEKLHGMNSRYTYVDGVFYCGSHRQWRSDENNDPFWRTIRQYPAVQEFCMTRPGWTVYGEVYGSQNLRYGLGGNQLAFAAFDVLDGNGAWVNPDDARYYGADFPWVPFVASPTGAGGLFINTVPYNFEEMVRLSSGPSRLGGCMREGIVLRRVYESRLPDGERAVLKLVSPEY